MPHDFTKLLSQGFEQADGANQAVIRNYLASTNVNQDSPLEPLKVRCCQV